MTEGKNREIRKILEHFNLKVNRLIRISYGPFELGKLGQSQVDEVQEKALHDQLTKNKYGVSVKHRRAGWAKPKKGIKQMHNKKKSSQLSVKIKK